MKWRILSNFEIERFIHRGLPFKRMREIKKQLQQDVQLRGEIENIENSNRDFKDRFPSDIVIPKIMDRYRRQTEAGDIRIPPPARASRGWLFAVPAVAAVLLLIFLLLPPGDTVKTSVVREDVILKGQQVDLSQPRLIVHRKKNSAVEVLKSGAIGRAGDLLQLAYVAAKQPYGMILSIDGNGNVSLHFPQEATHSTSLAEEKFYLPEAIELDNAPDFERFFFITSRTSLDVEFILNRARKLAGDPVKARTASIDLPDGFTQVTLSIVKEK